ncbi:MAG: histidinol-phosphate transaminase [Thermomicrobiales bacterium]
MSFDIRRSVRPHIKPAASYTPGVSPENDPSVARLDWNESPFPLTPRAQRVLEGYSTANRYPEYSQVRLREALASYIGTTVDRVFAGAGLDDVFNTLAMTIISPGDEVIISEPTFGVYRHMFSLHGGKIVDVPLVRDNGFELNADGILSAVTPKTRLIIVCNPNNPTGNLFDRESVERIARDARVIVAIDEAYAEFSGISHLDLANRYENVVLFRTLSKFAGLAGFRVGYGVFPDALVPFLQQTAPPFLNISALAAEVAIASLSDLALLHQNRDWLVAERARVADELGDIPGVRVFSSATNFLLFQLPFADSGELANQLASAEVFVRRYADPKLGLLDHLRTSIGSERENNQLIATLQSRIAAMRV